MSAPAGAAVGFAATMRAGIAHQQAGRLEEARRCYETALALQPDAPDALHLLGLVRHRQGASDEAIAAVRRAVAQAPRHPDSRFNLALMLRSAGRHEDALAAIDGAVALDPGAFDAQRLRAGLLAEACVGSGDVPPPAASRAPGCRIAFVICSIRPERFARLTADLRARFAGHALDIVGIHDARSLCEGYARGIAAASGDLVVLCHDDIEILTPDFADRLIAHLRRVDIVGVAGTTRLAAPVWTWAGWPALHGIVVHGEPDGGRCAVSFYGPASPPGAPVQALDGLFIAMRRSVLDTVRFDAAIFDGFHFYDVDFTYAAHLAGCAIGVATDIALLHHSPGRADASYAAYAERFRAKYRDWLPADPGPQSPRLEIRVEVASRGDAAALCRRLGEAPSAPAQQ